jgi:hypothetical protein
MMVFGIMCKKCNDVCMAIHFQQNFENWTSSNDNIDEFIQNTQLSDHQNVKNALEWIPYDRFYNIKYIEEEFNKVYSANWIDGNISFWDDKNQNWERKDHNMFVTLKSLNNPNNILMELENEVF